MVFYLAANDRGLQPLADLACHVCVTDVVSAARRHSYGQRPFCYRRSCMRIWRQSSVTWIGNASPPSPPSVARCRARPRGELIAAPATLSGRTREQTDDPIGAGLAPLVDAFLDELFRRPEAAATRSRVQRGQALRQRRSSSRTIGKPNNGSRVGRSTRRGTWRRP